MSFPKVETDYSSAGLELAGDALEGYKSVEAHEVENNVIELPVASAEKPHAKRERLYKKCNEILADIAADRQVNESDRNWVEHYVEHPNYLSEKTMAECFAAANGD